MPCPLPHATSRGPRSRSTTASPHETRAPRLGLAAGTGRRCFTAKPSQGLSELPAGLPVVRRCRRSPRTSLKAGKGPLFSPHLPCRGRRQEKPLRQVAGETAGTGDHTQHVSFRQNPASPAPSPPPGWVYPGRAPGNLAVGPPSGNELWARFLLLVPETSQALGSAGGFSETPARWQAHLCHVTITGLLHPLRGSGQASLFTPSGCNE